jgi:chromosome segregation protein
MQGFKSFADETRLEFEPGLTAVVGPNGCGKSNISDAVRWTLGEQRPTALRLNKMEEVIFSGSETRQPLGMATASLTIINEDKRLPIEFGEVTITRKLFRSGESEYYINQAPVRLRNIQELFMDTGLGSSTYSLIEQGKIDLILSTKPEDRRFLFEEAAGISKYKHRREETLRKLQATQENLLRLEDVIGEVRRQINSLKRQAGKAERYQQSKEELKGLELNLGVIDYRALKKKEGASSAETTKLEESRVSWAMKVEEKAKSLQELEERANQLEENLYQAHQKVFKVASDIERSQDKIHTYQERTEGFGEEGTRRKKELDDLKEKKQNLEGEIGTREKELKSLTVQIEEESAKIRGQEKSFKDLNEALGGDIEALENLKNEVIEILSRIAATRNDLKYLETGQRNNDIRKEGLLTEKVRIEQEAQEIEVKLKKVKENLQRHEKTIIEFEEEKKELTKGIEEDRGKFLATEAEIESLKTKIVKIGSHLELLKEGFGDYYAGAKAIMEARNNLSGIEGTVIDLIRTSPEYEKAIEAALGERIQDVVVRDLGAAREAMEYLKTKKLGRTTFLSLDRIKPVRQLDLSRLPEAKEALGLASGFVKCDPRHQAVVDYLLGNTLIVRDLPAAFEIAGKLKESLRVVTLEGEIIASGGEISGGALRQLLGRDRRRTELAGEIRVLSEKLKELETTAATFREKIAGTGDRITTIDFNIKKEKLEISLKERDSADIQTQKERVTKELSLLATEAGELDRESTELSNQRKELGARLENYQEKEVGAQERITQFKEKIEINEKELSGASSEVTGLKISLASWVEKETGLRDGLERMRNGLDDLSQSLAARQQEIEEGKTKKEDIKALVEQEEARQAELMKEKEERESELEELKQQKEKFAGEISTKREELKEVKVLEDKLQSEFNRLALQDKELELELENHARRIKEDYGISLEEIARDYQTEEIDDRQSYKARIEELRDKLAAMGPVNLVAMGEYKELEERYNFLTGQKKDLDDADASLREAIAKINRTTRSLFSKNFEQIRENFNQVFQRLFEGGKADLVLLDERNILESGIEIKARPPGRALRSISLLSGGEKALTAIALLFAIFMVKPSPFCVLDEIDAALDEANVARFTRVLAEFAKKSQFIIVTHNRGTIEASDTMYGVTMEERGISKLVSVKFAQEAIERERKKKKKSAVPVSSAPPAVPVEAEVESTAEKQDTD